MDKLNELTQKIWFSSTENSSYFSKVQENINVPDEIVVAIVLEYQRGKLDCDAIDEDDIKDFKTAFINEMNGAPNTLPDTIAQHLDLL